MNTLLKYINHKAHLKIFSIVLIFLLSVFIPNLFGESSVGVSVKIRELLVLEVYSGMDRLTNSGHFETQVSTIFNPDNTSVHVRVRLCVPSNKYVDLRVQSQGDLINKNGFIFPISNVGWHSTGPGFLDGILSKNGAQLMGTWKGSGIYEGNIEYYFINSSPPDKSFTQIITYSLVSL